MPLSVDIRRFPFARNIKLEAIYIPCCHRKVSRVDTKRVHIGRISHATLSPLYLPLIYKHSTLSTLKDTRGFPGSYKTLSSRHLLRRWHVTIHITCLCPTEWGELPDRCRSVGIILRFVLEKEFAYCATVVMLRRRLRKRLSLLVKRRRGGMV